MNDTLSRLVRGTAIVLGLSVVFTLLGVYGTSGEPFWERLVMWVLTIGTGAVASTLVVPWVFDRQPAAGWPGWAQVPIASAIISLPVTVCLILMDASDGIVMGAAAWPMTFLYVYLISLILTLGGYVLAKAQEAGVAAGQVQDGSHAGPAPGSAFLARLPARYRAATLYAVSSEDHYLRVHTDLGEELILMRLSDAIAMLQNLDGMQVHRSWWVARDAVIDVRRENDKPLLVLKSGVEAPVSRTFLKAVREEGYFAAASAG